jgi:hypothetical protein
MTAMATRVTPASGNVKTTVDLPQELWRAAKIRAMDDHADLRSVIIAALRAYLNAPSDAGPDSEEGH